MKTIVCKIYLSGILSLENQRVRVHIPELVLPLRTQVQEEKDMAGILSIKGINILKIVLKLSVCWYRVARTLNNHCFT